MLQHVLKHPQLNCKTFSSFFLDAYAQIEAWLCAGLLASSLHYCLHFDPCSRLLGVFCLLPYDSGRRVQTRILMMCLGSVGEESLS